MDVSSHTQNTLSRSNSGKSSNLELEKEIVDLDINGLNKSNNTISNNSNNNNKQQLRLSSSRTSTHKARRIRFYRNGDRFYSGIVIPVSNERYRYVFCIL